MITRKDETRKRQTQEKQKNAINDAEDWTKEKTKVGDELDD